MRDLLDNGETPARKAYLPTLVGAIIVGDKSVKIVGSKEAVRAAILGKPSPLQNVRGLGPDSNVRPSDLVWCTIPIDFAAGGTASMISLIPTPPIQAASADTHFFNT